MMFLENSDIYFTLRIVLLTLCTLGMMCSVTDFKYKSRKVASALCLFLIYTLAATGILVYFWGYLVFLRLGLLVISAPGILLVYRLAKNHPAVAVFNYATQILFSFYCVITAGIINTYLWNSEALDLLLLLIIYPLVIWLEYRFLRSPFLRLAAIVECGWGILSLIPCSLLLFTSVIIYYPVHINKNPSAIVLFYLLAALIVIVYFSIFQYLFMQYRFQFASHNMELLALQVNSLKGKISEHETSMEAFRIERHDNRHRFQVISSLLESGDTNAALEFIRASQAQEPCETKQANYCSNPILNAVLSSYLEQAKAEHIFLETRLAIPERLPADEAELSIVFANALENAIIACRKLPKAKRRITINCICHPSLMLEISNTYDGAVQFSKDKLPVSERNGHGIGSRSIAAFCKNYDALYSFHVENGWFTVKVVM